MLHQMTSPLIILACPPPSMTPLSAIRFAVWAHLVAADPLHIDMQNRGLEEDCLQTLRHSAPPLSFPKRLTAKGVKAEPPRQKGLATIMGRILGPLDLARPILAPAARSLEAAECFFCEP